MNYRNKLQEEFANKYIEGQKKTCFEISVRFGKTRLGIIIMQKLNVSNVLIAYPNLTIKQAWEDEFEKVGWKPTILTYCTYISISKCIDKYDLVILDEVQTASNNALENINGLLSINKNVLGLSGTYSEKTKQELLEICGLQVTHKYTSDQAIENNIVADYQINIKQYELSPLKWEKRLKTKSYDTSDIKEMQYINNYVDRATNKKFALLNRMRFINTCKSLKQETLKLIVQLRGKRFLIYGADTNFIDDLGIPTYHAKNIKEDNLNKFINGEINHLGLCKLANTGVSFPNLDTIIITNINSNSENLFQQIGRSLIKDSEFISNIYVLISNQEFQNKWLQKALTGIKKEKIKFI